MNLYQARNIVRAAARNARDQTLYSNAMIDSAILAVCARDAHILRYPKVASSITVQSGSNALDISALVTAGFSPHHFLSANIAPAGTNTATYNLTGSLVRVDYEDYFRRKNFTDKNDMPTYIAFADLTTAYVWPTPDEAYSGTLRWFQPFTSWTPGISDADATNTTLSLPDDWLNQILVTGVPARLQMTDPEHKAFAQQLAAEHEQMIRDLRDAATFGSSLMERGFMGGAKGYTGEYIEGGYDNS